MRRNKADHTLADRCAEDLCGTSGASNRLAAWLSTPKTLRAILSVDPSYTGIQPVEAPLDPTKPNTLIRQMDEEDHPGVWDQIKTRYEMLLQESVPLYISPSRSLNPRTGSDQVC